MREDNFDVRDFGRVRVRAVNPRKTLVVGTHPGAVVDVDNPAVHIASFPVCETFTTKTAGPRESSMSGVLNHGGGGDMRRG